MKRSVIILPRAGNRQRRALEARLDADDRGIGAGAYHYIVSLQPGKYLGIGEEMLEWTSADSAPRQLLRRRGRRFEMWNRSTEELESFEQIGLPASVMSQLDKDKHAHREAYLELLRFRLPA